VQIECLITGVNFYYHTQGGSTTPAVLSECPSPLQQSWQVCCSVAVTRLQTLQCIAILAKAIRIIQETQLSLTNRATHLCKCIGVADPLKTRTSPPVTMRCRIGRSALKGEGIKLGEPPKLGSAGTQLSWDWRREWPQDTGPSPA